VLFAGAENKDKSEPHRRVKRFGFLLSPPHSCKYFNSEVAASRSEVWAIAQVKYCAEGAK
jgi:hypothetical protein